MHTYICYITIYMITFFLINNIFLAYLISYDSIERAMIYFCMHLHVNKDHAHYCSQLDEEDASMDGCVEPAV